MRAHDAQHLIRLPDADLEKEHAVFTQGIAPLFADHTVEVEPVRAAVKRKARLVLAHGSVERVDVRARDVRRVADQKLELAQRARGLFPRVDLQACHPRRQAVAADVLSADLERLFVIFAEQHARVRQVCRRGKADASAARAEIQNAAGPRAARRVDELCRQYLGIRARDEHRGRNVERQTIELPLADEIRHRLARQVALNELARILLHLWRGVERAVAHQLLARFCRRGADELARRLRRLLVARAPQLRAQIQIEIIIRRCHAYHASLPFSSGMTSSSARMATSSMLSSGSLVVKFCSHRPGRARKRVTLLSCPPT